MSTVLAVAVALHTAVKYVAGAYVVFLAIVLIYVAIMAKRLRHTERDLVDLRRELESVESADAASIGSSAETELPRVARR